MLDFSGRNVSCYFGGHEKEGSCGKFQNIDAEHRPNGEVPKVTCRMR